MTPFCFNTTSMLAWILDVMVIVNVLFPYLKGYYALAFVYYSTILIQKGLHFMRQAIKIRIWKWLTEWSISIFISELRM